MKLIINALTLLLLSGCVLAILEIVSIGKLSRGNENTLVDRESYIITRISIQSIIVFGFIVLIFLKRRDIYFRNITNLFAHRFLFEYLLILSLDIWFPLQQNPTSPFDSIEKNISLSILRSITLTMIIFLGIFILNIFNRNEKYGRSLLALNIALFMFVLLWIIYYLPYYIYTHVHGWATKKLFELKILITLAVFIDLNYSLVLNKLLNGDKDVFDEDYVQRKIYPEMEKDPLLE